MLRVALIGAVVSTASCVPIYDEQLADRRGELEEHRREFLPPEERVQFQIGARNRIYWAGLEVPLNDVVLRSFDPAGDGGPITYEFELPAFNVEERIAVGDRLIAHCPGSGNKKAYDATHPDRLVGETRDPDDGSGISFQGGTCSVSGDAVYFIKGGELWRWVPGAGDPALIVDLEETGIGGGTIAGFAIEGDRMVFAEGGRLWLLDLSDPTTATWLENEDPPEGKVVVNERGVLYRIALGRGAFFVSFPDMATISLDERVARGGYKLNSVHADIHKVDDREGHALFGDQIIYRAEGGIFAYGIDTQKVQDILLDSNEVRYFDPIVLETGDLYVENRSSGDVTVYTVRLNDVLR